MQRTLKHLAAVNGDNAAYAESHFLREAELCRAYTTVAFLLALGEAMECPVRAMDEFDCFMDAANRNGKRGCCWEMIRIELGRD